MSLTQKETLCKAACELVENNLVIYPVAADKKPLLYKWNGFNAIRTQDRAQEFFLNDPKANRAAGIGVVCGLSGVVSVNVDTKNAGDITFRRLVHDLGYDMFEDCPQVVTPSLGMHFWFQQPATPIASRTHGLGQGIDVIGNGGGIIAPPTERLDGFYTWRGTPDLKRLPVFPDTLIQRLAEEKKKNRAAARKAEDFGNRLPVTIPEHSRNSILMRAAYRARYHEGYNEDELNVLLSILNKRCSPPLLDGEVKDMVRSVARNSKPKSIDPLDWVRQWNPERLTSRELKVLIAYGQVADGVLGDDLTPCAKIMCQLTGLRPEKFYDGRSGLEGRGAIYVQGKDRDAPIVRLLPNPAFSANLALG